MKKIVTGIIKLLIIFIVIIIILSAGIYFGSHYSTKGPGLSLNNRLFSGIVNRLTGGNTSDTGELPTPTETVHTPTPVDYDVSFMDTPLNIMEGQVATFTWSVNGPVRTIHKSAVYFGTVSTLGFLTKDLSPADTKYTDSVKEFLTGDFNIPIKFIGNAVPVKPGKYFARAYALIDSNNYWSEEREFTVQPKPGYAIKIVYFPDKAKLNENSSFTWEITGPTTTTGFTAIVGAKESKPGKLDETVDISKTPYKVLVKDFTAGAYNVPLRYIGNTVLIEGGTYYFRALAVIEGKNIWSNEFSFTAE